MTITKTTQTIESGSNTIKVTLERGTWVDDGDAIFAKTNLVNRISIELWKNGKKLESGCEIGPIPTDHIYYKQAIESGSVGLIGKMWFVKPETAELIGQAIAALQAENPVTEEMARLAAERAEQERIGNDNLARIEAERNGEHGAGWCERCQDYTYGDCGHH